MNKATTSWLSDKDFKKINKSKNKIIEDAYIDYLNFNEKENRTKQGLIEEIKHCIYVAQYDYDQWGKDSNYSIQCINNAKRFIKEL